MQLRLPSEISDLIKSRIQNLGIAATVAQRGYGGVGDRRYLPCSWPDRRHAGRMLEFPATPLVWR